MGGHPLNCPVCCNTTFSSKQSLIEHLTNALENVYCPVCNYKCHSLPHLVEHLTQDNCQPTNNVQTIIFEHRSDEDNIENMSDNGNSEIKVYQSEINTNDGTHYTTEQTYGPQDALNDASKMYVELFSKQLKPCLQTREFKLVKENGESRYMIVTQDDTNMNAGSTIVTKQNVDGTISLTTVKENLGPENLITPDIQETQEDNQEECHEEFYSCNTCKVSFSSVIDHIRNYHSDQEVVVEEPMEEGQTEPVPEYEPMENEDTLVTPDKQTPRRVITDTGDIVEEPLISEDRNNTLDPLRLDQTQEPKPEEKGLRVVPPHFLQVSDKLCDSVIKETIQADGKDTEPAPNTEPVINTGPAPATEPASRYTEPVLDKSGPYHKVIVKDVPREKGFPIRTYQCLSCDISVTNLDEFKIYPCKVLKYPCLQCPVAYENSKSLCAHMKVHKMKTEVKLPEPVLYQCMICSTVFPTNKSLKLHRRMHDPVKARPIEPPVENTDGSEVSEGTYRCGFCNKLIPIDYKIIHQNSHKASAKMNCTICNKKFTSMEYLEMHTSVHNVDKVPLNIQDTSLPYCCLFCNRRFARPHEKVKHERIHTGEKPHTCEICGKSFRVSYCLTLHMRTHTGARPYACPHCGKRFKAHSVYNHHLLTHSEVRAYKCTFCPKAFKTSVQLAGHKNSHTKPFSCQYCNRPFASLYAVRVHTETHGRQNNLKFSCELCGATYARAFALKDHIKQAHKDKIEQAQKEQEQAEKDQAQADKEQEQMHSLFATLPIFRIIKDHIKQAQSEQEQAQFQSRKVPGDEEWPSKENHDTDGIPVLKQDLTHEIDLGMTATELIVP